MNSKGWARCLLYRIQIVGWLIVRFDSGVVRRIWSIRRHMSWPTHSFHSVSHYSLTGYWRVELFGGKVSSQSRIPLFEACCRLIWRVQTALSKLIPRMTPVQYSRWSSQRFQIRSFVDDSLSLAAMLSSEWRTRTPLLLTWSLRTRCSNW